MPLKINVPDSPSAIPTVALGGINYEFEFSYSDRTQRYSIDIRLGGNILISGLKVIEDTSLTSKYDLPLFDHGQLFIVKLKDSFEPAGRDNFGIGKAYELLYYTNEELIALGIT